MTHHIKPFGFILMRVAGAVLLFWLSGTLLRNEKIDKKDWSLLVLCGLFGVAINQLFFFWGLSKTSPINSSIIMVTNPIMVLVIAAIWLKERIATKRLIGVFIGLSGAITLLLVKPEQASVSGDLMGDMFILINSLSYAIYLVIAKPLMFKYHPVTVMKWAFLFGFFPVLLAGYGQFTEVQWSNFSTQTWWAVAFVVIATTFLAYLLNTVGLKKLSPSVVSAYIYLQPVFSTLIALMLGMDRPDFIKVLCALFIFTGVYLVSLPQKVAKQPEIK